MGRGPRGALALGLLRLCLGECSQEPRGGRVGAGATWVVPFQSGARVGGAPGVQAPEVGAPGPGPGLQLDFATLSFFRSSGEIWSRVAAVGQGTASPLRSRDLVPGTVRLWPGAPELSTAGLELDGRSCGQSKVTAEREGGACLAPLGVGGSRLAPRNALAAKVPPKPRAGVPPFCPVLQPRPTSRPTSSTTGSTAPTETWRYLASRRTPL